MNQQEIEEYIIRRNRKWFNDSELDKNISGHNEDIGIAINLALRLLGSTVANILKVTQTEIDSISDDSLLLDVVEYNVLDMLSGYICDDSYSASQFTVNTSTSCKNLQKKMEQLKRKIDASTTLIHDMPTLSIDSFDLHIDTVNE